MSARAPLSVAAATLFAAMSTVASGCDGADPITPPAVDAGPRLGIASTAQIVAWEGQTRFVTVLSSETGEILDGATVEAEDPDGPLSIVEQRCAGTRCGVVLRIEDQTPNVGRAVPAPIDADRHALLIRRPDGDDLRAVLNVMPLDVISGGGTAPRPVEGLVLASAAMADPGSTFVGVADGAPIRWVVFGDAALGGALDVSADAAVAGPGGFAGGAAETAGEGPGGGFPGLAGGGAGGGGHLEPGIPGDGAGGEDGAGGAGGPAAFVPSCLGDFDDAVPCGGSGGGGASLEGGAGGGVAALVVLGRLDLSGGALLARGGAGTPDAGGGAGGALLVAAPEWTAPAEIDVSGGPGMGLGGAGGAGAAHVQVPGDPASVGPAAGLAALPSVTGAETISLTGTAAPGATVVVERSSDGVRATATADGSGAFAVEVELLEGLNRLRVLQDDGGGEIRSWVGTSIELERRDTRTVPVGAFIDVARL